MFGAPIGILIFLLLVNACFYWLLIEIPDGIFQWLGHLPTWLTIAFLVAIVSWCLQGDSER